MTWTSIPFRKNGQLIVETLTPNGWVKDDSTRFIYSKGRPDSQFSYQWEGNGWSSSPYSKGSFGNCLTGTPKFDHAKPEKIQIIPIPVENNARIIGLNYAGEKEAIMLQMDGKHSQGVPFLGFRN